MLSHRDLSADTTSTAPGHARARRTSAQARDRDNLVDPASCRPSGRRRLRASFGARRIGSGRLGAARVALERGMVTIIGSRYKRKAALTYRSILLHQPTQDKQS